MAVDYSPYLQRNLGEMKVESDHHSIFQGPVLYESIPYSDNFIPCLLALDMNRQQLTCYNETTGPMRIPSDKLAPLIIFKTDCISLVEDAKTSRPKHKFCFALHYLGKVFHFQAHTWRELGNWIEVIKNCSKISVPKSQANPNRVSIAGSYQAQVIGGRVVKHPIQVSQTPMKRTHSKQSKSSGYKKPDGSVSSEESGSDAASIDSHQTAQSHGSAESKTHESKPIKTGFCVKQGALMKNWKRRFLVLGDSGLRYYKNGTMKKMLRRIWASEIQDVRVSDSNVVTHRDNLMEVVTSDRTFFMQFDSQNEMHSWIEEIRKHVNLPVKTYL